MKVLMYKFNSNAKVASHARRINIERLLFIFFIISFMLLVIIQAALTDPAVRAAVSADAGIDGVPLGQEVFLYEEGSLVLTLANHAPDANLKILINGSVIGGFDEPNIKVSVKDGDVVEIDGSEIDYRADIVIMSKSQNIETDCVGDSITTNFDVTGLVKVKMR